MSYPSFPSLFSWVQEWEAVQVKIITFHQQNYLAEPRGVSQDAALC